MERDPSTSSERDSTGGGVPEKIDFDRRMCDPEDEEYDEEYAFMKRNPISEPSNENEVFLLDAPNCEIDETNTKWIGYAMGQLGSLGISGQNARLVGHNHVIMAQSVRSWLLHVDLIVLYKEGDKVVPAVLTDCRQGTWHYRVAGRHSSRALVEKNIIVNVEEAIKAMKEVTLKYNITGNETNFYIISDFEEAQPYLGLAVYQCVDPGQFLEYQLSEKPEVVCIGRILRNYRGLLMIWFGPNIGERWVHMSDPYLHAVGWSRAQDTKYGQFGQKVSLVNDLGDIGEKLKTEAVPSFVFRNNYIPAHRLREGDIMIVADHFSNGFLYSHMVNTNPPSDTFFHLAFGEQIMRNPDNGPCYYHIHHPKIFSVKKIKASGLHIQLPTVIYLNVNEPDIVAYKRVFSPTGRVLNDNCGVNHLFLTTLISKFDYAEKIEEQLKESEKTLRFVEILRPVGFERDKWQLTGAVVTGQKQNILRLATTTDKHPVYMHMHDWKIFHLGTCTDMRLAVAFDKDLLDIKNKEKKLGKAISKFATF